MTPASALTAKASSPLNRCMVPLVHTSAALAAGAGGSYRLIMCPIAPWKVSCIASLIVGCVCTLRASSLAVRSHF